MSWLYIILLSLDVLTLLFALYHVWEDLTRFAGRPKNGGRFLMAATAFYALWLGASYCAYIYQSGFIALTMASIAAVPAGLALLFLLPLLLSKKRDFK